MKTSQRLTPALRLRSGIELREITRQCRAERDQFFNVHVRSNKLGHARLGITVSRRVSPKAVIRNRVKRVVRESFRLQQEQLKGLDVVVVARPPAAGPDRAALREALQRHWKKAQRSCSPCSSS